MKPLSTFLFAATFFVASPAKGLSGTIVAVLGDGRLVAFRSTDGKLLAELRPPSGNAYVPTGGPYLALSRNGREVFALLPGPAGKPTDIVAMDVRTWSIRRVGSVRNANHYNSISVGTRTDRVFLGGAFGGEVAALNADGHGVTRHWHADMDRTFDWGVYRSMVSPDERRFYFSYHGAGTGPNPLTGRKGTSATGGIDWFELHDTTMTRCKGGGPNTGCIHGHGRFEFQGKDLLVATGGPAVGRRDATTGRVLKGYDIRTYGNQQMEFAVDHAAGLIYTVGSCLYTPGFHVTSLRGDVTKEHSNAAGVVLCGERIAVGPSSDWVAVSRTGRTIVVDAKTGATRLEIPTSTQAADLIVLP